MDIDWCVCAIFVVYGHRFLCTGLFVVCGHALCLWAYFLCVDFVFVHGSMLYLLTPFVVYGVPLCLYGRTCWCIGIFKRMDRICGFGLDFSVWVGVCMYGPPCFYMSILFVYGLHRFVCGHFFVYGHNCCAWAAVSVYGPVFLCMDHRCVYGCLSCVWACFLCADGIFCVWVHAVVYGNPFVHGYVCNVWT